MLPYPHPDPLTFTPSRQGPFTFVQENTRANEIHK